MPSPYTGMRWSSRALEITRGSASDLICRHVTSSIPGAAFRFSALYASRSRSIVIWCIRLVNLRFLSFFAASRILLSSINASPCLCVQFAAVSSEFPLVTSAVLIGLGVVVELCRVIDDDCRLPPLGGETVVNVDRNPEQDGV